jgi:hypothetical protein
MKSLHLSWSELELLEFTDRPEDRRGCRAASIRQPQVMSLVTRSGLKNPTTNMQSIVITAAWLIALGI